MHLTPEVKLIDLIINISSGNPNRGGTFCQGLSVEDAIFTAEAQRRGEFDSINRDLLHLHRRCLLRFSFLPENSRVNQRAFNLRDQRKCICTEGALSVLAPLRLRGKKASHPWVLHLHRRCRSVFSFLNREFRVNQRCIQSALSAEMHFAPKVPDTYTAPPDIRQLPHVFNTCRMYIAPQEFGKQPLHGNTVSIDPSASCRCT